MISIDTLREIGQASEISLVTYAEALGKKHDEAGLTQVFKMLLQHGFSGPVIAHDNPVQVGGDGSQRNVRMSDALMTCLESPSTSVALLDAFVDAHVAHGSQLQDTTNILLFRAAASVHRQDVAERLLNLGATMGMPQVSATNATIMARPYDECLMHGNAEMAIAIVNSQPEHVSREMMAQIAAGRTNKEDTGPRVIYPEADMLVDNLTTPTENVPFGGLPRLLDAFEKRTDDSATSQARFQLLQRYLVNKLGDAWSTEHLETIVGGPVAENPLLKQIQDKPSFFKFSTTTVGPFVDLLQKAVQAQCAPILHEYRDAIAKGVNEPDPYSSINNLFVHTGQPFVAAHFEATLKVFLDAGHALGLDRHGTTLLHRLSLSHCESQDAQPRHENHTFAKLKILLDAGANPRTLSGVNAIAGDEFDADDKARWNNVVRSHAARSTAHSLLEELNFKASPAYPCTTPTPVFTKPSR